jgi:hypothetical protein
MNQGDTMDEIWKAIPGFGGHYEASSLGRIRALGRTIIKQHRTGKMMQQFYPGRILSPHRADKWGHLAVNMGVDGTNTHSAVHRLVLLAFAGPCPEGMEACHNNGNASDNRPENLRWDTHHNNNQDRRAHGTYAKGEAHPMAKLTPEQVLGIRSGTITKRQALHELGISNSQHHRIKTGQSWAHL